jgi:hypothetical protein
MRKKGFWLVGVALMSLASLCIPGQASAACGSNLPTNGGTATFTVNVPAAGTYRFWTHLYSPSNNSNGIYLRVDTSYCQLTVGDAGTIPANAFTWIEYQNATSSNKIDLNLSAGNHTVTFAGLDAGC